ncbi:hypothetical protein HDF10_000390 [Edaphobacter lichenicola]|uniref:Uncharacterized protein n=1 Tax=Tunturiibacter lichenicola TaxID=2051959 RepID=A0A7W8N418_9BACT|nr:hypothetical protein [Edaphobacter lichenicola]
MQSMPPSPQRARPEETTTSVPSSSMKRFQFGFVR